MADVDDLAWNARLAVRRHARQLVRDPADRSTLFARLQAAFGLPGSEPVQGALADLFVSVGQDGAVFKRHALDSARARLATHVVRWFDAHVSAGQLEQTTPLATRWSVLARPSADITTRARRCSGDDSRALAERVVDAVERGDAQGQQAFFHHCMTCHDKLAFMLARRALMQKNAVLPEGWNEVSVQLQQLGEAP